MLKGKGNVFTWRRNLYTYTVHLWTDSLGIISVKNLNYEKYSNSYVRHYLFTAS